MRESIPATKRMQIRQAAHMTLRTTQAAQTPSRRRKRHRVAKGPSSKNIVQPRFSGIDETRQRWRTSEREFWEVRYPSPWVVLCDPIHESTKQRGETQKTFFACTNER